MPLTKVFLSNSAALTELSDLLHNLSGDCYQRQVLPGGIQKVSSIGAHCRHIIEFYQGFLKGIASGNIDYDNRARDPELEVKRSLAIEQIESIKKQLSTFVNSDSSARPFYLQAQVDLENTVITETSFVRELIFLQTHTVHHQAMIALLMHSFAEDVPEEFGFATSTQINNRKLESQATD